MKNVDVDITFITTPNLPFDLDTPASTGLGGIQLGTRYLAFALARKGIRVAILNPTNNTSRSDGVICTNISALEEIKTHTLVSSNNAQYFLRSPLKSVSILWMRNPTNLEKSVRRGQVWPILRTRPHAVFVGEKLAKRQRYWPWFSSRHVIGHGVADFFQPTRERVPDPVMIWTSSPHRGLQRVLKLWITRIAPHVPNGRFLITSQPRYTSDYDDAELKNAGVEFIGRQSQEALAALLKTARVMFYPGYEDETFCIAAAEAICSGVPVVTQGIGSLSERVRDGETGFIRKSDSELCNAVVELLTDDSAWLKMQPFCREERGKLSWDAVADRWLELCETLKAS